MSYSPTIKEVMDVQTGMFIDAESFFDKSEEELFKIRRELEDAIHGIAPEKFVCMFCKQKIKIRGTVARYQPKKQTLHFAHLKDSDDCPIKSNAHLSAIEILRIKYNGAKESWLHKKTKATIAELLGLNESAKKGVSNIIVDKVYKAQKITGERRRPDVCCIWNGDNLVFEIQLSTTFLSVIAEREHFYKEDGAYILWIFKEFNLDQEKQRFTEKDILYTNKQNVFVLDDEAIKHSLLLNDLILKCYFKKVVLTDRKIAEEWASEYVSLSDLKKDQENKKLFYYDIDVERHILKTELNLIKQKEWAAAEERLKDIRKQEEAERIKFWKERLLREEQQKKLDEQLKKQGYGKSNSFNIKPIPSPAEHNRINNQKRKTKLEKANEKISFILEHDIKKKKDTSLDDIYKVVTNDLHTRTALIQIYVMNTGEIKQEIEKLFNNGYRLSEADEFFLITRLKVAQGRIQVEAWRRFSEALQLAITLWNLHS